MINQQYITFSRISKTNTVIITDKDGTKTVTKTENVEYTATTDANGVIIFKGLAAGTYEITEIEAPDGYNILPNPITVTINWTAPSEGETNCTWTYSENVDATGEIATVTVENNSGTELPSTGGIGTTIFYIVGGLLVVGAAVLLVTRRKLALEK